jgi:subtilisin family serine protease
MTRSRRNLHRAALAVALAFPAIVSAADPPVAGEALVQLSATSALTPLLQKYPFTLVSQFGARPIYRLKIIGNANLDTAIAQMSLEPTVVVAEVNRISDTPEGRKNAVWAIGTAQQYAVQWGPAAMNLPQAQALSSGGGVRVAVLDTGVDFTHPALAGHLLPGRDFVDGDNDASEVGSTADEGFGHGTHVAGLVALTAPGAKIVPLRVLDRAGRGNVWVLAEAMLYAVDPDGNPATADGAHVINASLGTLDRPKVLEAAIKVATCTLPEPTIDPAYADAGYNADRERCRNSTGAVVVAAAGNGGSKSEKQYPAAEGEYGLLPVTATQQNGQLAAFANFGTWVEVAAPGDRITSTVPGGYATWSGTSMASPLAAGTAALIRAKLPTMSAKDVARRIEDSAVRICNTNQARLDALAAVKGTKPNGKGGC